MTITVQYTCKGCGGLKRVKLDVPVRGAEDVIKWMEHTVALVSADHRRRSPTCKAREMSQLLIPHTCSAKQPVGGPTIQ